MNLKSIGLAILISVTAFQVQARPFSCNVASLTADELTARREKMEDLNQHARGFLRHSLGRKNFNRLQNGEAVRMGPVEQAAWKGVQMRESCINEIYVAESARTQSPIAFSDTATKQIPGVSMQQGNDQQAVAATPDTKVTPGGTQITVAPGGGGTIRVDVATTETRLINNTISSGLGYGAAR